MKKETYTGWGVALDFSITVLLLILLCGSFWLSERLLYPDNTEEHYTVIETEKMPLCHSGSIKCGQALFDTVTKRKVGTVTKVYEYIEKNRVYYRITLIGSVRPRSMAMRTQDIWFYFTDITEEYDAHQQI